MGIHKIKSMVAAKKSQKTIKKMSKNKATVSKKTKLTKGGHRRAKPWTKGHKETFNSYVYRVLKQVHPDLRISKKAMAVCDALCKDVEGRLLVEMRNLCNIIGSRTCKARQAMAATKLVLPGELGKQ